MLGAFARCDEKRLGVLRNVSGVPDSARDEQELARLVQRDLSFPVAHLQHKFERARDQRDDFFACRVLFPASPVFAEVVSLPQPARAKMGESARRQL